MPPLRFVLVAFLLAGATARACEKVKGPGKQNVRISVVVVLASTRDTAVHKKLVALASEVRKVRPEFKGFRIKEKGFLCKSVRIGNSDSFNLLEGEKLDVVILSPPDKLNRVRLKVTPPRMGEITYEAPCGKFLPILTPFQTKSGDTLLIAIRVAPCNGK